MEEDKLLFKAHGLGVAGSRDYTFEIDFYLPIDAKVCCFNALYLPYFVHV